MSHKKFLNTLLLVIATVMLCLGCQFFVSNNNKSEKLFVNAQTEYTNAVPITNISNTYGYNYFISHDIYSISNETELRYFESLIYADGGEVLTFALYNFKSKTIVLTSDITLSSNWSPIGSSFIVGNNCFGGTFDGNGHSINNMNVDSDNMVQGVGFFGYVANYSTSADDNPVIKNLEITNAIINLDSSSPYFYKGQFLGIVVGYGVNATIENCRVENATINITTVEKNLPAMYCGGILGLGEGSTSVKNCTFNGNINVGGVATERLKSYIGGIAGDCASEITSCYAITNTEIDVENDENYFGTITYDGANVSQSCWGKTYGESNIVNNNIFSGSYGFDPETEHYYSFLHKIYCEYYGKYSSYKLGIQNDDDPYFVWTTLGILFNALEGEFENEQIIYNDLYYYEQTLYKDGLPCLNIFLDDESMTFRTMNNIFEQEIEDNALVGNPTRTNYFFKNWCYNSDLSVVVLNESLSSFFNSCTKDTECPYMTELYAKYDQYTLTLNLNGGTYNGISHPIIYKGKPNDVVDLPAYPNLTKTGYSFANWTTPAYGSIVLNKYTFGSGNSLITAQWSIIEYTVFYNLNAAQSPLLQNISWNKSEVEKIEGLTVPGIYAQQTYTYSVAATSLLLNSLNMANCVQNLPSNWTFAGWYFDSEFNNIAKDIPVKRYDDIYLYAKFVDKIVLTFDYNSGDFELGALTKNDGPNAIQISATKSAYEIPKDISYYSDLNLINEFVDLPIPTCTGGYYFSGWQSNANPYIKTYSGSNNTQFPSPADSHTLTAKWSFQSFFVQIVYEGGNRPEVRDLSGKIITQKYDTGTQALYAGTYGLTIEISEIESLTPLITRFDGWEFGLGDIGYFIPGKTAQYTFDCGYLPGIEEIYPIIQAKFSEYSDILVTFDYDGATGGANVASKTVTYGSTYGPLPTPTKVVGDTQYIFDGWYLEDSFITKVFESTTVSTSEDHPLYAKFVQGTTVTIKASREARSYSFIEQLEVIYKDSSGEQISTKSTFSSISVVVPINTRITLKATPMQGCTFDRWENDYGTEVSGSSVFSFYASNSETYWAYATAPEYVYVTLLEYYANGTSRVIRVDYGERYMDSISDDNLNPEYRSNKTFKGWYYYPDFSGDIITIRSYVTRTYDYNLYPKWESNEVTATFYSNSGNILANINWTGSGATVTKTLMTGASYGVIPTSQDVSKYGYTFVSWHTDAELTSDPITPTSVVESDISFALYAKYIPVEYTIAYNGNATNPAFSGSTSSSIHQFGVAKNLTTNGFSRIDYDFVSWNTAANGMGTSYTNGQSVTNVVQSFGDTIISGYTVTLYAQWERKEYTLTINIVPEVGEILIEQYEIYSDTTTTEVINTTAYEYIVYSGNNITLQAFDQVDVLTGEGDIVNQTQYLGYLFDNWNGIIYEKTTTINSMRSNITQNANYKKVQYVINFGIKYDTNISTDPGTLNLSPNNIVSFGVGDTVSASYIANLGYKISTGWEWDIVPTFTNLSDEISVLVDTTYLNILYALVGTESCENETQNLGNIYINTTKVEIPLLIKVVDAYRGEEVSEEIQDAISLSFKVSDVETSFVELGENLRVQPNTPDENYIFQKWSLLTTANKAYYTMKTSSAFTFTVDSKLLKACYILPDETYPDGRMIFEITIARTSIVTFETGDYGWGGVEKNSYIISPYSGFYGETVQLATVLNDGYTLTGYEYEYKNTDDANWSELIDITKNEFDEFALLLQSDNIHIYPQYTQNTYIATLSIVQKSNSSTIVTLLNDWTSTDILTASVLIGNDYPNYNGTYTVNYKLIDSANYNVLGLYKNDYNGTPVSVTQNGDGSFSKTNYITDNVDFYIVIASNIDTVSLSVVFTTDDYVGERIYEQDSPAIAYLTLNEELIQYNTLELETGDSFTIHYTTNKGYYIYGYQHNQNDIVLLTESSGTITITDFDSTKQGVYKLIFGKIEYTLSVNNNLIKGNYSANVSNLYLYQTFDLTGSYNEGYRFIGFECNSVQYTEVSNVIFVPEMIASSTTIVLTPVYINQYSIELQVNNPQYGQVETYINGQPTNFSGLYDANTLVTIELTTDLNHLLDSYLGIEEAPEVQLSSGTEKLYTIEFNLADNRHITLNLDGILLEVIVLNNMTMGECSFNLSSETGENQYIVTARYEDLLNITVTANAGYRFDKFTANDIEITSPIEILENGTITVNYIKTYVVTTSVNDSAMGTITAGGIYDENTSLTINANAKVGYEFIKWTINGTDVVQPNEYVFELTQDMDIVAHFDYVQYTFDFSSVENYFTTNELSEVYHYGDIVSVTLTEKDVLFILKNIFTNGVGVTYIKTGTSYTFSILVNDTYFINKVCVVTADLINQYVITISTNPTDISLLQIDDAYAFSKNGNEYIYCEGDALYLYANDDGYYQFSHYTNTALLESVTNRNYTLLATQDMIIEAVFDAKSYQISVIAKELIDEEMIDLDKSFESTYPASAEVYTSIDMELTNAPLGFEFLYFYYDEILPLSSMTSSLYIDQASDYIVYAVFERINYSVTCTTGEHYTFKTTVSNAKVDDEITLVVELEKGYEVTGWTLNGVIIDNELLTNNNVIDFNSVTFSFVPFDNDDSTIYNFAPVVSLITYEISTISNNETQGSASFEYNEITYTTTNVTYGDSIYLVATLLDEDLYRFIYWMLDGQVLTTSNTYSIVNIDETKAGTYTAVFGLLTGTISIQVTPERAYFNPTISVDGETTTILQNNDEVTVSINTNRITPGYVFVGWHHNILSVVPASRATSYTFTITKENRYLDSILICEFAPKDYAINIDWSNGGSVVYSGGSVQGYLPATNNFNMSTGLFIDMISDTGYELGEITITNGDQTLLYTNFIGVAEYGWQIDFNSIIAIASEEITYIEINYVIMSFDISYDISISNGNEFEAVLLPADSAVTYGTNVDVDAILILGFNFDGWYIGDVLISEDLDFVLTSQMIFDNYTESGLDHNVLLTAHVSYIEYDMIDNIYATPVGYGDLIANNNFKYKLNDTINLNALPRTGFKFVGYYINDELISTDRNYSTTFAVSMTEYDIQARFAAIEITVVIRGKTENEYFTTESFGAVLSLKNGTETDKFLYNDSVRLLACSNYGYTFDHFTILDNDCSTSSFVYDSQTYQSYVFTITTAHLSALQNEILYIDAVYDVASFTINFSCNLDNLNPKPATTTITYKDSTYTGSVQALYGSTVNLNIEILNNLFMMLGFYNGDSRLDVDGTEYEFVVNQNLNIVAKISPIISFANFDDAENKTYLRTYNFETQALAIGTDVLCHESFADYVIISYSNSTVAPSNAGTYSVTARIDLPEFSEYESESVTLTIQKLTLTVTLAEGQIVSKEYDGFSSVSKTLVQDKLVLNGLIEGHEGDTALSFNNVTCEMYSNSIPKSEAINLCDLVIKDLMLTNTVNFKLDIENNTIMFENKGKINQKKIYLNGINVKDIVYNEDDPTVVYETYNPAISGVVLGDAVSLDLNSIAYEYVEYEIGRNKTITGSATLLGIDKDNYELIVANKSSHIYPYELTLETEDEGTFIIRDINRNALLPIDGTIEITNYLVDTPIYIELYQIIEPYLGRRNTFEIAYSIVVKDGTNVYNVTKPVQFEFHAPFKVDNDVNAYLIDETNVTPLTTSVDDAQVLVTTTKLNNIVILKSKILFPVWLIILVTSIFVGVVTASVVVIVIMRKRKEVIFYRKDQIK